MTANNQCVNCQCCSGANCMDKDTEIERLTLEIQNYQNDISTLQQEHVSMRARMERLEAENESLQDYKYRYESCAK